MNVPVPHCETCTNVLRIDRIALNEAHFLTAHFRCDGDDSVTVVTFDGDVADYDIVLAQPAPVAWVRSKLQPGVVPVNAIRRIRPVEPIQAFGS